MKFVGALNSDYSTHKSFIIRLHGLGFEFNLVKQTNSIAVIGGLVNFGGYKHFENGKNYLTLRNLKCKRKYKEFSLLYLRIFGA